MKIKAHHYSLLMGAMNAGTALVLFGCSRINALAGYPSVLVALLGPAATVLFTIVTIAWWLDALRPGVLRRFIPMQDEDGVPKRAPVVRANAQAARARRRSLTSLLQRPTRKLAA